MSPRILPCVKLLINIADWAALNGRIDVIKALLTNKADPNAENEFGRKPI
jgi:ankyrin repeat protein